MCGVAVTSDAFIWRGGTAEMLIADLAAATIIGAAMKFALRPSVHQGKRVFMVCNVYLLLLFVGIIAMTGIPK
jgi:heme O synthase-like polyprenyltransferase